MLKKILITATLMVVGDFAYGLSMTSNSRKDLGYLVLGTIVTKSNKSVALLKHRKTGKTKAVRLGSPIEKGLLLTAVTKKFVTVKHNGKFHQIRVGSSEGFHATSVNTRNIAKSSYSNAEGGLQRDGGKVTVSSSYKEHLLKTELPKILMQAAAVPAFDNGKLKGFTLWEITPGSIYEKLGFKNGDTVTSINNTRLVDASQAVKILVSLKKSKNIALSYQRGGVDHQMEVAIQ